MTQKQVNEEGEFKKRIKETLEKAETSDINAFAILMCQDIDEAKKDFLSIASAENAKIGLNLMFVKWFGESSQ